MICYVGASYEKKPPIRKLYLSKLMSTKSKDITCIYHAAQYRIVYYLVQMRRRLSSQLYYEAVFFQGEQNGKMVCENGV